MLQRSLFRPHGRQTASGGSRGGDAASLPTANSREASSNVNVSERPAAAHAHHHTQCTHYITVNCNYFHYQESGDGARG
jgi:hypothetical protein